MRLLRSFFILLIISFLTLIGVSFYLSQQLSTPARRPLMEYHQSWLTTPADHGVKITQQTAGNAIPVLVVEPDGTPAKRGATLRGQLASPPPFGEIRANLVLLHGRKGRKEDLLPVAERFCAVGFRCLLIDMPAHGDSPLEQNDFATSDASGTMVSAIFRELRDEHQWGTLPTHLLGMSMGGAYANKSLQTKPELWEKAIIICSFDRLEKVVDSSLQKAGPLAALMKPLVNRFSSFPISACTPAEWAQDIPHPVFIAHGTDDTLITHDQGKRLYQSYPNPQKKFVTVQDADHNNILITDHPLYKEMTEFLYGTPNVVKD